MVNVTLHLYLYIKIYNINVLYHIILNIYSIDAVEA